MSPWRSRPDVERVIVDEIGPALLVHAAGDPTDALAAMTSALPPEPGRIAIVTAPSVTIRSDYLQLVGQIIDDWLRDDDTGVRLIALGHAEALAAAEPQLRALAHDTGREVVIPLGPLSIGADGTVAAAAPSGAGGGWMTCMPGAPPRYEPAWFPLPAWAKDLPPEPTGVRTHGAAGTYPVPAGYWILPRAVTPGRAGAASTMAPDPTMATVFLGGCGEPPLTLPDVVRSLAALPFPDRYRLVLLPAALRTRADAADLRASCDPPVQLTAAVPVWSGANTWTLAFVAATGALISQLPPGERRARFPPDPRGVRDPGPARQVQQVRQVSGRPARRRVPTGTQTAAGWSFVTGSDPVGMVPTPVGFVVEVTMDTTGCRVQGKSIAPGKLADLIAEVCPPHCRTVVVIAHDTPPTGHLADALFSVLANVLGTAVIAADSEVSMSRTGLLYTSGQFRRWRTLPTTPGTRPQTGPQTRRSTALGDTLPPLPTTAPTLPDQPALTARPAPAQPVDPATPGDMTAAKRTVATPAEPQWITEGSCDTPDRLRLRQLLDGTYEAHARMVVHQLFTDQETYDARPAPATVTGLVAVRAYCTTQRDTVNGELRGAGAEPDGATSTLIAACAMYGLRHLPIVSGPVFATCPIPVPVAAYETGAELVEPAFVDVGLSPNHGPGDGVDYHIWSLSARRLGSLAADGRGTAVFAAGSRFLVLGVEAGTQRPRVMLLDLAAPSDPREEIPDTASWVEEIVEVLRHGHLPAGRASGPDPRPLAFPVGLDGAGRPYQRRDHSRHPAAPPDIEHPPHSGHIRRHRHVPRGVVPGVDTSPW